MHNNQTLLRFTIVVSASSIHTIQSQELLATYYVDMTSVKYLIAFSGSSQWTYV